MFGALLVVVVACVRSPAPVASPPLPTVPPPPPPHRDVNSATVTGRVLDSSGSWVSHAEVMVRPAGERCVSPGDGIGGLTDERGEYVVVSESGVGPAHHGCVVVEARAGGTSGVAMSSATFTSDSPRVEVDVQLQQAPPLTPSQAEELVLRLVKAINHPHAASSELNLYILHGPEALRVALQQYRHVLGEVTATRALPLEPHDPQRYRFELLGSSGRTSVVDVYREDLIRLHSPYLDYGFRGERFVNAYLRAISSGDAVMLSRILNPDDIDFPVEKAREMIVGYRQRYRDTATIRPEFVDFDETRHLMRWRLRGTGIDGETVTEILELGFGDGLVGLHDIIR